MVLSHIAASIIPDVAMKQDRAWSRVMRRPRASMAMVSMPWRVNPSRSRPLSPPLVVASALLLKKRLTVSGFLFPSASGGAGCRDRADAGRCEATKLGQSRIRRHQFILDRILDEEFSDKFRFD
jgi:hypothetical protein